MHAYLSLYRFDQKLLPAFADSLLPATSLKLTKHLNRQRGMSADFYACETPPVQSPLPQSSIDVRLIHAVQAVVTWYAKFIQLWTIPAGMRTGSQVPKSKEKSTTLADWNAFNYLYFTRSTNFEPIWILIFPIFVRRLVSWWRTATTITPPEFSAKQNCH